MALWVLRGEVQRFSLKLVSKSITETC